MAKQIIVLPATSNGTDLDITAVFWFPITSGAKSGVPASQWTGASTAENTAIQAGTVLEEVKPFWFPVGIDTQTIKNVFARYWLNRNTQLNGIGPNIYYGVFDDSITGWSA